MKSQKSRSATRSFLCIYGFRFSYPKDWRLEFDPKSESKKGTVVVKSLEKAKIYVSWEPIQKVKERYPSVDERAEAILKRVKSKTRAEELEVVETKDLEISSHRAKFNHARIVLPRFSILPFTKAKGEEEELYSMQLYCESSSRCFAVYGMTSVEKSFEYKGIFEDLMHSFSCHE